jgi:hypothetical protein
MRNCLPGKPTKPTMTILESMTPIMIERKVYEVVGRSGVSYLLLSV